MIVSRYGLHIASGDIPFLVQPSGSTNLISPDLRCPFEPQVVPRRSRCPHAINLADGIDVTIPSWVDEPLAQMFLPTPCRHNAPALLLYDPNGDALQLIRSLERLVSPVEPHTRPIWWKTPKDLRYLYGLTNLGPMVWTSTEMRYTQDADKHIDLGRAFERKVLLVATERMPLFTNIAPVSTFTLPPDEPLEAIGAACLRRYMSQVPLDL
jgi:hypothetical protein